MSELDTLRWGDSQTLVFFGPGNPITATVQTTKQMLHAHWKRPLTWQLLISIVPKVPAAETGTFVVTVNIIIGVGATIATIPFVITIAPVAGVYPPVVNQFFQIPAQDVQVQPTFDLSAATDETLPHSFTFTALIAPLTEPHGYSVVGDLMARHADEPVPSAAQAETDQRGMPRWMPAGFSDGELAYRGGPGWPPHEVPSGWSSEQYRHWLEAQGYR